MRVVAVSDVTVGYGTPQLPRLTASLADHYRAESHIVEPVQPELASGRRSLPGVRIHSLPTAIHPHSDLGRTEYLWHAIGVVNRLCPEVLVISSTYCLPVVFRLRRRPRLTIYYSLESIPFYGPFDEEMNCHVGSLVDVVIFPEENRAALEVGRFGFHQAAKVILYNATTEPRPPLPFPQRNGRILSGGTISLEQSGAAYYTDKRIRSIPVDLYGPIRGMKEGRQEAWLAELAGSEVRYQGLVTAPELAALRPAYLYSIVWWNPSNENQRYAAPNKLFEAIADGVPPIAAPHPQCKLAIDRYGCGLLMADWSLDAFAGALEKALRLAGTPEWERMVAGCVRGAQAEFRWEIQFDKLRPYLRN